MYCSTDIPMYKRLFLLVTLIGFAIVATAADLSELEPWSGNTPTLVLKDLDGKQHHLDDYRGKVVVLNFWATWCAPCVKEMPSLQTLAEHMSGEQFALLTVNFGEKPARIKPFLRKIGVDLTVLLDPDMAASRAWVKKGLPTTFIIGPDQRIRYRLLGDFDWAAPEVEQKLRQLLPSGVRIQTPTEEAKR